LAAGLSQEELALDAGIDRTYVSMLERGIRLPTIATLLQIAPPLSIKAWELLRHLEEAAET
jgi:transcriptional regulator with XRE-family HTH domain